MHAPSVGPPPAGNRGASRILTAAFTALIVAASGALTLGQKLDKAADAWLKQYRMQVLPEEVQALRQIKDPADVTEFEKIFWARRNPAPPGADNPYKAAFDKAHAAADARFSDAGRKGSVTGCGQIFMLLGDPDEVLGTEIRTTFEDRPVRGAEAWRRPETPDRNATRDGARRPETWTYKSNPQRTFLLARGELRLQFDSACEFEEGARVMEEIARVAASRVVHPEVRYEFQPDGRLRPLAAAVPPASKTTTLLDEPRSDFPAEFELKIQMPGQGGAYTAGILRGGAGALPATPSGGKPVSLKVAARAVRGADDHVTIAEREVFALVQADGSFVTSYGFTLPPGQYAVTVGVVEPASGRGAVAAFPVDAPDYARTSLVVGPLVVLSGDDAPAPAAAADPFAAFVVGDERLPARPGNALGQSESLRLLVLVHNAALDPASGKAALRARFTVLRDGALVARGKEQVFDTASAAPSVGPIALAAFAPGRYLARAEIADEVAKTQVVRETPFEVRPPDPGR